MTHIIASTYLDIRGRRNKRKLKARKDIYQETQGLLGDGLLILGMKELWAYVELSSQGKFVGETWEGMRGWVELSSIKEDLNKEFKQTLIVSSLKATVFDTSGEKIEQLGYGTKLSVVDDSGEYVLIKLPSGAQGNVNKGDVSLYPKDKFSGDDILHEAEKFLGLPYFWGGCSSYQSVETLNYGVDCSGLIYLIHRVLGKEIPRNAVDQFKNANPQSDLEVGDLIFYATPENPEKVIHVILYAGDGILIEATDCARKVRKIPFNELFDGEIESTKSGDALMRKDIEKIRILHYGSFHR